MIGSDSEYRRSVALLEEWRKRHTWERQRLEKAGHTPEEIERLLDPSVSFHLGIADEVEHYETQLENK